MMKMFFFGLVFSFLILSFISPDILFHWQSTLHGFLADTYHLAKAQINARL